MGCTLNHTAQDHAQAMGSLGRSAGADAPITTGRNREIRTALNRASSRRIMEILSDPGHPAHGPLANFLEQSVGKNMTSVEKSKLPEVFHVVVKDHPDAMGLFRKPPSHRGPGASRVQHHYEIFCAAALMQKSFRTIGLKELSITPRDRVDFGIKFARGYAQPRRYGTIEADILVGKGSLAEEKTIAIDSKFSKIGRYGVKEKADLQRQLDGVRTGFRDGKIDEFIFVTNGTFTKGFHDEIKRENLNIARDFAEKFDRLNAMADREQLTREERESIPAEKKPAGFFREDNPEVAAFVEKYDIPQIDVCQHVKFPGT